MEETDKVYQVRMHAVISKLERNRDEVITGAELATWAGFHCSHETNRRRIREIIAELREQGYRICAGMRRPESRNAETPKRRNARTGDEGTDAIEIGYWIARDATEWAAYLESLRTKARFEFVKLRTMREAATDKGAGQTTLFGKAENRNAALECFSA